MTSARLLVFDVNETLSDMSALVARFVEVGAPGALAATWFGELLRDGFALTVSAAPEPFARLAEDSLRLRLEGLHLDRPLEDAVQHVLAGFAKLQVHSDVPGGLRALASLDLRLVTLSNGSAHVAETLLERAGVRALFERFISVEEAGIWKPAPGAYAYALAQCGIQAREAMLVAVHPWDIDGAARAGLATAWINRSGGGYPAYFTQPDLTVASIQDLASRLD